MRSVRLTGLLVCLLLVSSAAAVPNVLASSSKGSGGTFTFAVARDPGNLNPLVSLDTIDVNLNRFLYDPLVHEAANGQIESGVASSWSVVGDTATFHIRSGITCSDGSPVTPTVIAENFAYLTNAQVASPLTGAVLPNETLSWTADDATNTFVLHLSSPFGFLLRSIPFFPIVCGSGIANPSALSESASGSGPYTLTSAQPGNEYVMVKRQGYTWGPGGTSNADLPNKIVMKIISNETTTANLLLSGGLNAAVIDGPDRNRVTGNKFTAQNSVVGGVEMIFNEAPGRPGADPAVRRALAISVNRAQVATVASQGLTHKAAYSLVPTTPVYCNDSPEASAIPAEDVSKAATLLTNDGWIKGANGVRTKDGKQLKVTAPYLNAFPGNEAAMELIDAAWKKLGVEVTLTPLTEGEYSAILFGTGNFDVLPLGNVEVPDPPDLVTQFSGATPPTGINTPDIDNPTYNQLTTEGAAIQGHASCADWNQAEGALYKRADVIPMVNEIQHLVLRGFSLQTSQGGRIIPTSIRATN
jgi:peptide/nickel transport system substrate-binding protein